jgi:Fe-S oxidoreductase
MLARELLLELGIVPNWVIEPIANCFRTGNHLGIQPHGMKESLEFLAEEIEDFTGIKIGVPLNKKGAKVLFVVPSADYFAEPGLYTCMGYLMLFHEIGLDYTFSTYASDGGNFGLFASFELMKRLNAKIYAEAKRLKVEWILGGECGHMWRVLHQYMDTLNGPPDFLKVPYSPLTGTVFEYARSTKAVHVCEFTADLIHSGKIRLDPSRNAGIVATFHDSCNVARAMGMLEEPRYILDHVVSRFVEMPPETIREKTFCCGSGAGIGAEENLEIRLKGGFPRGNAVRYVRDTCGVNALCCICAIDRATLPAVCEYWSKGVEVYGLHELVGNALVMQGEKDRTKTLRGEPISKEEA